MIFIFLGIFIILSMVSIFVVYDSYGRQYIKRIDELPDNCESIIVLGAGIRKDGKPCDLLADRLFTAAQVYNKDICKNIFLTGDHQDDTYNEVAVMRDWIINKEVHINDITLDGCGFCTYNSIYNAKNSFNISKAIISTNQYHLPRAIYLARKMGIEAYGIASDLRQYDRMKKYKRRERLAQIKDFILVNINNIIMNLG